MSVFDDRGHRVGGALLLAVVTSHANEPGRFYRLAQDFDYDAVWRAATRLAELGAERSSNGLSLLPDEPIPHERVWKNNPIRVHHYGMARWADLFTSRQALAIATLIQKLRVAKPEREDQRAVQRALTLAISRQTDYQSALCLWHLTGEKISHTFGRQAIPMVWDFAEVNPFSRKSGGFDGAIQWIAQVWEQMPPSVRAGQVAISDADKHPLPTDAASVLFTDPPYYDAVPYAKLANYFYVWQRRALIDDQPDLFGLNTLDGVEECVVDEARGQDRSYFERKMAAALGEARRIVHDNGIGGVVFAHKTTEGWEALLSGMIHGGWTITGSWPIATEMGARLRARESAALATSVHLVCRPRAENALIGDWAELFQELPNRIGDWMERLSSEGVRGADLIFACIGPAMEVYSRYSKVEDAEGREIPLGGDPEESEPHKRGFLAHVWEIVGRTALGQVLGTAEARARNGAAGALEEDSRLTALFLWTIQSTSTNGSETEAPVDETEPDDVEDEDDTTGKAKKGLTLIYDVVRRFSQPLGIHLDNWEDRIIETKKGIVRLAADQGARRRAAGRGRRLGHCRPDRAQRRRSDPAKAGMAGRDARPLAREAPRRRAGGKKSGRGASPDEAPALAPGTTTLDRVHIAMLLQAAGKSNALRTMLKAESEHGQDFLRLANALSALYPRDSEEKRLVDAMLLAMPK